MIDGSYEDIYSIPVDEALCEAMFGSPSQGGAALGTPWFFEHALWTTVYPRYERGSDELPDHFAAPENPRRTPTKVATMPASRRSTSTPTLPIADLTTRPGTSQ
jgi:hypothetical protein